MSNYIITRFDDFGGGLEHHGIKGQKWGVRRYQNPDGSLTEEGLKRYSYTSRRFGKGGDSMQKYLGKMAADTYRRGKKMEDRASRKLKNIRGYEHLTDDDWYSEVRRQEDREAVGGAGRSASVLIKNMNVAYSRMTSKQRKSIMNGKKTVKELMKDPIAWNSAMTRLVKAAFNDKESESSIRERIFEESDIPVEDRTGWMKRLMKDE